MKSLVAMTALAALQGGYKGAHCVAPSLQRRDASRAPAGTLGTTSFAAPKAFANRAEHPHTVLSARAVRPLTMLDGDAERALNRFELLSRQQLGMRLCSTGQSAIRYTGNVVNKTCADLTRAVGRLNTLSFRGTVMVLGTPVQMMRARQARRPDGAPTRLDAARVVIEIGLGPLAMLATTIASLSLLLKHCVVIGKVLIPAEMVLVALSMRSLHAKGSDSKS